MNRKSKTGDSASRRAGGLGLEQFSSGAKHWAGNKRIKTTNKQMLANVYSTIMPSLVCAICEMILNECPK